MDYKKEFSTLLLKNAYRHRASEVFRDFVNMAAVSIAQPFYRSEELEREYMNIVKKYTKEEAENFARMLAITVNGLEASPGDFLGEIYMENDMGNARTGQFFTPYHLSYMMAEIVIGENEPNLLKKGYLTVCEPACGSGGMVVAIAEVFKKRGYNHSAQLYVEATDIDYMCFHMSYVQLSLMGIAAKVIRGDSLWPKADDFHLYTAAFFLNDWPGKFQTERTLEAFKKLTSFDNEVTYNSDKIGEDEVSCNKSVTSIEQIENSPPAEEIILLSKSKKAHLKNQISFF